MCQAAVAPVLDARKAPSLARRALRTAAALTLWPLLLTVPLGLSSRYAALFPKEWYDVRVDGGRPSPLGLSLGIGAVAVGQVWVLLYQYVRWRGSDALGALRFVQPNETASYAYSEGVVTHLSQPEGFVLIGAYLSLTWMLQLLPASYYHFEGGVDLPRALLCLLCQDALQYAAHRFEHKASAAIYRASHKPHHRFTNPRLFDAFNGSLADTVLMIILPLYATARLIHCNVWTYMTFGSLYANWLVLIHSEFGHAWDPLFSRIGFGTAADHHVHHKLFTKNYGHLFMYWDYLGRTYMDPRKQSRTRRKTMVVDAQARSRAKVGAAMVAVWVAAVRLDLGTPVAIVLLLLALVLFGFREKWDGETSAYSVFNQGQERIAGTFTAEEFERQLRGGPLPQYEEAPTGHRLGGAQSPPTQAPPTPVDRRRRMVEAAERRAAAAPSSDRPT